LRSIDQERRSERSFNYLTVANKPFFGSAMNREGRQIGQFLAGDPDMLIEEITAQKKATGAGILVIRNEMGPIDLPEALEGLELFAKEVLPIVQKL